MSDQQRRLIQMGEAAIELNNTVSTLHSLSLNLKEHQYLPDRLSTIQISISKAERQLSDLADLVNKAKDAATREVNADSLPDWW